MNSKFGRDATKLIQAHSNTVSNMIIIGAVQVVLFLLVVGFLIAGLVTGITGVYVASLVFFGIFCIIFIVTAVTVRRSAANAMKLVTDLFDE